MRKTVLIAALLAVLAGPAAGETLAERFPGIPAPRELGVESFEAGFQDRAASLYENTDASSRADIETMRSLLAQPRQRFGEGEDIQGDWQIRSGQVSPYAGTLYPWFKARILQEETLFHMRKDSGSQRKFGHLLADDGRFFYLGRSHVSDEVSKAHSYFTGDAPEPEREERGYLVKLGKGHMLLMLEAKGGRAEILELKR